MIKLIPVLGELRSEEEHRKQTIKSRWNPEGLSMDARYLVSKGASSFGCSFFPPSMYAMDELHLMLNLKISYENTAISILSFCTSNTVCDPEFLSGKYSGNTDMKRAKTAEAQNRRTIGILRWEQQMRAIHGKSSSVKVCLCLYNTSR